MNNLPLKPLAGKLSPFCRRSLEQAAALCQTRTNYEVEIEHWLLKLIEMPQGDVAAILRHFQVEPGALSKAIMGVVERLKRGNGGLAGLSPGVVEWMTKGWLVASIQFGWPAIRSGHLLLALLSDEDLERQTIAWSDDLQRISVDVLRKEFATIVAGSVEDAETAPGASAAAAAPADGRGGPTATPSLDQFTIDLTAQARAGKLDPVIGRDAEVRQVIDILTRRRQNNPILTGEAGVGKTAVAEGFAQRVVAGDVPESLRGVSVRTLDLGALQAGAGVKGEFENRLKSVIDEVKGSPTPIILFIDEAHTLIGAGGSAGQGDAANLLKPALARGELRTIAATTWAEYKKYFEKDAALARRFQVVKVEEPEEEKAVAMMRGMVDKLERHFGVEVVEDALRESVRLSKRYIPGRQLPDKSVSLLDTACARVALQGGAGPGLLAPPAIEDSRRRIELLSGEQARLEQERQAGSAHEARLAELESAISSEQVRLKALEGQLAKEREIVDAIRQIRTRLAGRNGAPSASSASTSTEQAPRSAPPSTEERAALRRELDQSIEELRRVQGEAPLLQICVDGPAIADVVAGWTGIPVGRMVSNEIQGILNLRSRLRERIIGQDHALDAVAEQIRTSRAGLADPRKPTGVFLFVGTSGVGKTETAVALSELVYGSEENMTVINMSEFKEEHKVSLLMGAPPGYVGYGEGGVLTEAVRRRPYSVILLDEMEKAHPGVQDVFYQVFDKGSMKDGEGRDIDFRNSLIIMTSNAATDEIQRLCEDPDTRPEPQGLIDAIYPTLLKTFKPAFLGRVRIVSYFPLPQDVMRKIVELQLGKIRKRLQGSHRATFGWSPEVVSSIVDRCTEVSTGARNVEHILSRTLLPELSAELLARMAEGKGCSRIDVGVGAEGRFTYGLS